MTRKHGALSMELDSPWAAISRGKRFIRDFADMIYVEYSLQVCAQCTSYCDRLNAMLADAQMRGEYLGGFWVRVSENEYFIYVGDAEIEDQHGGRTAPSGAGSNEVEVVPPPVRPS